MTRPPPFSPLSVCPKPLPSPRPFGTRTPAQAAEVEAPSSSRLSDRGRKGTRVLFILSHFPRQCKSFTPLFAKKARADNLRGRRTPIPTCSCMPAYANAAQSAAIRGDAPASYGSAQGRGEADRAMAQVGPRPAPRALHAERGGAPVRGRLTFHYGNGQPLRPSQRSSRSSRRPAVQKGRWRPHSRPAHKRRSRGSVLRRPVRFFGAFCSPLSCFSVRQYSIIQT